MTRTTATLVWSEKADAVGLLIPHGDPNRPTWWQTDQEVVIYSHGENIVIRQLKVCEVCKKDHDNRFTVCEACENL